MSIEAIRWALERAPDVPPTLVASLLALANHADPDGKGAAPSQARIALYTRKTTRSVRRDLTDLQTLGLIRQGDQRQVAYLPPDRRPVVWDLAVERTRPIAPQPDTAPHPPAPAADRCTEAELEDARVLPLRRSTGHPRPIHRTPMSTRRPDRPDADVRRTEVPLEVPSSGASSVTAVALTVLTTLGTPWTVDRTTIDQLLPEVTAALIAGWPADRLREHLAANPFGVRSPAAVLRARLAGLPPPPAAVVPIPSARTTRRPAPLWCGDCRPSDRMTPSSVHPGKWISCPACGTVR